MRTRTIFMAVLGLSLASFRMVDDAPSAAQADAAAPAEDTTTASTTDTGAAAPAESGEGVAAASNAADTPASDVASSALTASAGSDTAATTDPVPPVLVDVEDHAEARDRFAGLMAKLHTFEDETVAELKADLHAIGTLLGLHSLASSSAETTGDYKPTDLS